MMEITPQGIKVETFDDIFDALVEGYQSIYGADIDLDQNTADGQRIGISAKANQDLQAAILELYNAWDVEKAQGIALERIIALCGIVRRPATKSVWDIEVTASRATTLYAGYTVKDDAGQEWVKSTALAIPQGTTTVTFEAKDFGAIAGLADSVMEQVTVIPEVTGLEAPNTATVGVDEESDFELRQKRNRSLQNPSFSTVGSLTAKIAALPNVVDVFVYENKTNVTNTEIDLGGHSIWVVVEGGDIAQIAETMAKQKTAGTGEKGEVVGTWVEVLPNGVSLTHEMRFDRPDFIDLFVRMDATQVSDAGIDADLIKQNLEAKTFTIGQGVEAYTLYPVAGAGLVGNAYLSNLEISLDGTTWTDGSLDSVPGGKYVISADNITVTEL